MIQMRTTGGAIVGRGRDLAAIQRFSRRVKERPEVVIRADDEGGAECIFNWPKEYASAEVHFNTYRLAEEWCARNCRGVTKS